MPSPLRAFVTRLYQWLWGYDFFISYQWTSGGEYAANLYHELASNYSVFLDRTRYSADDDWRKVGEAALDNTYVLIVIATEGAICESQPVAGEIRHFGNRRPIFKIVFPDNKGADAQTRNPQEWTYLFGDSRARLTIKESSVLSPDPATLNRLAASVGILRKRNVRAGIVGIAIVSLATATTLATVSYISERGARKAAETSEQVAKNRTQQAIASRQLAEERLATVFLEKAIARRTVGDDATALLFLTEALKNTPQKSRLRASVLRHVTAALRTVPVLVEEFETNVEANVGTILDKNSQFELAAEGNINDGFYCAVKNLKTKVEAGRLYHEDSVTDVSFSNGGDLIATSSMDYSARLWDVRDFEPVCPLLPHNDNAFLSGFADSDRELVTYTYRGDLIRCRKWRVRKTSKRIGQSTDLQINQIVASGSSDCFAILTDSTVQISTRENVIDTVFTLPDSRKRKLFAKFSRDADWLVAGTRNGQVVVWSIAERRATLRFEASDVAFLENGSIAVAHNGILEIRSKSLF